MSVMTSEGGHRRRSGDAAPGRPFWGRFPGSTATLLLLTPAVLVPVLSGCANAEEPAVRDVAASFAGADPDGRCTLLAPATMTALEQEESSSCPDAIGQLPLGRGDVVSAEVWGEDALVRLTDDTLFLTRTDTGWRVSAAACEPGSQGAYRCQLEGP